MPAINQDRLVAMAVSGQIANALIRNPYRVGRDGVPRVLPGTGGLVLNRRVGDRAMGLAGDHVEPGASIRNSDREAGGAANRGLLFYSCIGNVARVTSGPASGLAGTVVGKHGGINNVIVDFPPRALRHLRIGDRVQIETIGQGLELVDLPHVRPLNLSPRLLSRWGVRRHGEHLHVPVTHVVPAGLMGSGLGRPEGVLGDIDIQLSNVPLRRALRLEGLRMGDLVAICPFDTRFGGSQRWGSMTIGVVVHSDSQVAGHGPGVTPLLIGTRGSILPVHDPAANIATLLGLRGTIAAPVPMRTPRERAAWRRIVSAGLGRGAG